MARFYEALSGKKGEKTGIKIEYPVNLHEEIIKWAVETGRNVPKNVLEEYPDIAGEQ